jgi:perosamine synthetase
MKDVVKLADESLGARPEEKIMQLVKTPLFKVFMPPTVMEALERTLFSGYIAEGEKTAALAQEIAQYIGNPHTVMMSSCTMALMIAYRLAGVGPGDQVITTPLTSIASNVPIVALGGIPVWADVDPRTGMSDPADIERLITERTKAIMILHKDGDLARLDEILALGAKYEIKVIEDAAHAFGAKYKGLKIGNQGDYICFSFQAIKHITTGDGGALLCKDEADTIKARQMKWFGVDKANRGPGNPWLKDVDVLGYKGDMNSIAATIGLEQMKHVSDIVAKFHHNGMQYSKLLQGIPGIQLLERDPQNYPIFWAYTLLAEQRDALIKKLAENGVSADQIHPRNDVLTVFAQSRRELPNVDDFSHREVSLPCGWWVDEEELSRICEVIRNGW